jgi:serine/threonine-protein kinase HipA
MGRRRKSSSLNLFMNGEAVGRLNRLSSGKLELLYADEWINSAVGRSISLSLPIVLKRHTGDSVENYFDNLLPDSMPIRNRIQARFGIAKGDSFDLLAVIGKDCIGALQMLPEYIETDDFHRIVAELLTDNSIAEIQKNYRSIPLGMNDEDDFRISIGGAQ